MIKYNKITFLIVPVVVYLILIFYSDIEKIIQNIAHVKLGYFLLFVGFWSMGVVSRIFRWNFFIRRLTTEISFYKNILYFLSGFSMLLSPGRVGEIIRSPFIKRDYGIPISKTAAIVFVERFYDILAVVIIIAIVLFFTTLPKIIIILPLGAICVMMLLILNKKIFLKMTRRLQNLKFVKNMIPNIDESFEVIFQLLSIRFLIIGITITLSVVVFEAIGVFYLLESLNTRLDFVTLTAIFHTSNFIAAASLIPGGFGILEGGFSGLLILYNVSNHIAVSASILLRIIATGLFTIVGLISLKLISKSNSEQIK